MSDEIQSLLSAIKTALEPLKVAGTINALEIMNLGGERGVEVQLARIGKRPPFMVIGYNGGPWKKINQGGRVFEHTPELTIMIGVAAMTGGATARDGLLDLQQEVMDALGAKTLSLDIAPLDLGRTSPVVFGKGFTVYGITVKTRLKMVGS